MSRKSVTLKRSEVMSIVDKEIRAFYGGGKSKIMSLRFDEKTVEDIDRIAKNISKRMGFKVSRSAATRAILAVGLAKHAVNIAAEKKKAA